MARLAIRRRGVVLIAVALALALLGVAAVGAVDVSGGPDASSSAASDGPDAGGTAPAALAQPGPPRKITPPEPAPLDVTTDRSVVRTARLALTVADLPQASGTVRDATESAGGFVANERSVDRSSNFTLRVPSPRLDEVLTRIAASGKVTERGAQADDVTEQVVDLEGRLATQRASVARVRALLDRANTVGEVVSVESELTQREAELESVQRRLAAVSGQVSLSTLTVTLTPEPAPGADTGFLAGLTSGWRAFGVAAGVLFTVLGAVLPFAVPMALVAATVLVGRRMVRRGRGGPIRP